MEGGRQGARGRRGGALTSQPECPGGTPFFTFPQISTLHDSLKCHEVYLKTSAWKSQPDPDPAQPCPANSCTACALCKEHTEAFGECALRGHTSPPHQVLPGQMRPKWGITQFRKMQYASHPASTFSLYVCRMYSLCLRCHVSLSKFKSSFLTFLTIKKLPHHSINPPSLKYMYIQLNK